MYLVTNYILLAKNSMQIIVSVFKDLCAKLEVTLFGDAAKFLGKRVSGNYSLVTERNLNDTPSWKKDDDFFLSRRQGGFQVCSRNIYHSQL